MIIARSTDHSYQVSFTNGEHVAIADVPKDKNGEGCGFGPHELLEAALSTCLAITLKKYAAKHNIPLEQASAVVRLIRTESEGVRLEYALELAGLLSEAEREMLSTAASRCPVATTLSGRVACLEAVN